MTSKIFWLFLWVTLTYWLGGLAGCASDTQNYKVLEEDDPSLPALADREPEEPGLFDGLAKLFGGGEDADEATADPAAPPGSEPGPGSEPQVVAQVEPPSESDPGPAPEQPDPPAAASPVDEVMMDARPQVVLQEKNPSLIGLDRSHWNSVAVGPDVGVSRHNPRYFQDILVNPDEPNLLRHDTAIDQINAALARRQARTLTLEHGAGFFIEPVKMGIDLIFFLPDNVISPLWSRQTTPEGFEMAEKHGVTVEPTPRDAAAPAPQADTEAEGAPAGPQPEGEAPADSADN